jgi:hypothetical protein
MKQFTCNVENIQSSMPFPRKKALIKRYFFSKKKLSGKAVWKRKTNLIFTNDTNILGDFDYSF